MDQYTRDINSYFATCKPLLVYVIIACLLSTITILLSVGSGADLASQIVVNLVTILLCSGLLYWLCGKNQMWAWILLAIIVLSNLGFIYTTFVTTFKTISKF